MLLGRVHNISSCSAMSYDTLIGFSTLTSWLIIRDGVFYGITIGKIISLENYFSSQELRHFFFKQRFMKFLEIQEAIVTGFIFKIGDL